MDITFNCTKCGQHITIDEAGSGMGVQCPKCQAPLKVPAPKAAPVADEIHKADVQKPTAQASPETKAARCITFSCVNCGGHIEIDEAEAGEFVECPKCHKTCLVPSRQNTPDTVTTPPEQNKAIPMPDDVIARVLMVVAALDFLGGIIAGAKIGEEDTTKGWLVFLACVLSGIFVLGFAFALEYLHAIAYRLEKIEIMHRLGFEFGLKHLETIRQHLEKIESIRTKDSK